MKLLFITVFAVLGVSVCPGQTLADILNSQYDDNPIPTVPVEYTLPRLAAKAPFVQLFNSLLLATGHRVFHSDEYEADEYILMRIKAEDLEIEMSGSLCRYPHETKSPIGWMPFHGKTIIFSGDNPGLFTPTEETRTSGTRIIRKTPCMVLRMTTGLNGISCIPRAGISEERGS